ncbi:hypothetical protein Tco_1567045, partial [Tanacetum coccineum]
NQITRRSAYALPTIAHVEAPHSRNHDKSPLLTQRMPLLIEAEVRNTAGDKIGKELLHFAPSPYYTRYPYDEGLSSNPPNLKKELFKDPKLCKTILDQGEMIYETQLPTQVEHLSAELAKPKRANHALEKANHSRSSKQDKESFAKGKSQLDLQETELEDLKHQTFY